MNPLTHVYFVLELFKNEKLTQDEKDHLIVGSIIPDIHLSGMIHFQKTHTQGLKFFKSVQNPLHKYLALGVISHGEEPKGLDFYTHQSYIPKNQSLILPVAKKYKKQIGKIDHMTAHHLLEFAVEISIAEKNPKIVSQILTAFQNPKIESAVTAFSYFLGFTERKNRKILSLLKNKHLTHFFQNFSDPETTIKNWHNLTFFLNLNEDKKQLPFRQKLKKLTQFSYFRFKEQFSHKKTASLFQEINSCLSNNIFSEFSHIKKEMTPIKNKLIKEIKN